MWWTWCISGLVLLGLEALLPSGFFMFFFGIGALGAGVVVYLLGESLESWMPWALFSLFSITTLLLFRSKLKALLARGASTRAPELSGEIGIVAEKGIGGGGVGLVELRGTQWQAKNGGDSELAVGARVRVRSVKGLTVEVVAE